MKLQMGLYPRGILIFTTKLGLRFMTYSISDHIVNIALVTVGYIVSMLFVQFVIVPVQQTYLPMITTFAALIFPLHGVRVLAAWLFGWRSIFYLFLANILTHFVLTPNNELTLNSLYAWILVSCVAWVTFASLKIIKMDFATNDNPKTFSMWKLLLLVGFLSSIINSLGHNIIFARNILPENSISTMIAFVIGDTTGTFLSFLILMVIFRMQRTLKS